jgi:hypothetical protein
VYNEVETANTKLLPRMCTRTRTRLPNRMNLDDANLRLTISLGVDDAKSRLADDRVLLQSTE